MTDIPIDDWGGCYPSNWKGIILPEGMTHPAKFSSRLIRRIYEHAKENKWISRGDTVLDPFGGIALGAWDAMRFGLHWTGIELEPKFFELGFEEYKCNGISKEDWKRYYFPRQSGNQLFQLWRKFRDFCPSCERALEPVTKLKDGKVVARSIPEHEPHTFRGNIPHWNYKFGDHSPGWGSARLINGDSRFLLHLIHDADLAVSSPPYAETQLDFQDTGLIERGKVYSRPKMTSKENYGSQDGQLGAKKNTGFDLSVSSPPFLQEKGGTGAVGGTIDPALMKRHSAGNAAANGYGKTDGQLSSMGDKDFDLSVSSPPYNLPFSQHHNGSHGGDRGTTPSEAGAFVKYGNAPGQLEGLSDAGFDLSLSSPPYVDRSSAAGYQGKDAGGVKQNEGETYGETPGQLGTLRDAGFDASISSPPFEDSLSRGFIDPKVRTDYARAHGISNAEHISAIDVGRIGARNQTYGETPGQLGADSGDSFWLAARAIVDQTYAALKPGGHAIWVVKGYVKNKKYVDFPDMWRRLCEAAGFVTLHEHRAMLIHKKGSSHTLEGGMVDHVTDSKSFFRRVYEKNGGIRIDWETVICMEKTNEKNDEV